MVRNTAVLCECYAPDIEGCVSILADLVHALAPTEQEPAVDKLALTIVNSSYTNRMFLLALYAS